MVAKSYQNLEIIGDVFTSSGRQYVNVKLKSGKIKTVRWYSESEYNKMYPAVSASPDREFGPQKIALGFSKGYITIFKGDTYSNLDWFRLSIARYARWWGWYIASTDEIPADLPEGLVPVQITWEQVGQEDGYLKPDHLVKEAVESIIYEPSTSEFVGSIGERINIEVIVKKNIELDGKYGRSQMHIMGDAEGNSYVWTTSAKNWAVGTTRHIRGTVKDHRVYRNEKQTVLNRCSEVK